MTSPQEIEWFPSTENPNVRRTTDPRWRLERREMPPSDATSGPGWYLFGPQAAGLFMGRDPRDAEPMASVVVRSICLTQPASEEVVPPT